VLDENAEETNAKEGCGQGGCKIVKKSQEG